MKRVALAGLGTVGSGVRQILREQEDRLAHVLGENIEIGAILVRDIAKYRAKGIPSELLTDQPESLFAAGHFDGLLEATGDTTLGYRLAREAMNRSMHVITAGKALVSRHMEELHALASEKSVHFLYEASVCGGIPLLKPVADLPLTGSVHGVRGIMNGSSNYILSGMTLTGGDYDDLVRDARSLGYLEADAADDLMGYDARRKLRILATLAFGGGLSEDNILCEGISRITRQDVKALGSLGYTIKLIAGARRVRDCVAASVFPWALAKDSVLAGVGGAGNCVEVEEEYLGRITFSGAGAGALPTAHAMVSDLVDALAGRRFLAGEIGTAALVPSLGEECACFYLRGIDSERLPVRQTLETGLLTDEMSFREVMALLCAHPKGTAIAMETAGR